MTKLRSKEVSLQDFLLAKAHLKNVKELDIAISGISMLPMYAQESQTTKIKHIENLNDLKRFDIIVFWQNNVLISHYYWKKNEHFLDDTNNPYIVTRPLNPIKSFDHPITSNHILGILPEKISFFLKFKIFYNNFF